MKNIQIIDGAVNATFSIFQATDEEFATIFPDGRDMELVEDLVERLGEEAAGSVLDPLWNRPILKRDALGIHGTLFYDNEHRREHIPADVTPNLHPFAIRVPASLLRESAGEARGCVA